MMYSSSMPAPGSAALSAEEQFSVSTSDYTAKDIAVLEGIQAIRHRPGMYIGSTSTGGLVHLLWEALDNAVDEAVAGYGTQIWVDVDREGIVRVLDEGRGMPFDTMTYQGKKLSAATVLMTVPHSGGKFAEGAYKTAGGLHGVGATIINALSAWLELDIWRDGQHFAQRFERGKALPPRIEPADQKKHGTQLRWRFDAHDLRPRRVLPARNARAAAAGGGAPESRAGAAPVDVGRRAGDRRHADVPLQGRPGGFRAHRPRRPAPSRCSASRSRSASCASRCRSKWRCCRTAATSSTCTRSPTRSERPKAGSTSAASKPR